jgi:hypothetical protein
VLGVQERVCMEVEGPENERKFVHELRKNKARIKNLGQINNCHRSHESKAN